MLLRTILIRNMMTWIKKCNDIIIKTERKLEAIESKIELQRQTIDVKDEQVLSLENKLIEIESNFIEKLKILDKKVKSNEIKYTCDKCTYSTNSEIGLKTHVTKKHKSIKYITTNNFPHQCSLCDSILKDKTTLKKHMLSHSYKLVQYKCDCCDFVGSEEIDMEVHAAKLHGEDPECGICEYQAKDMPDMETHLTTCEFHECTICEKRIFQFTNIKEHFLTMHLERLKSNSGAGLRNYKPSRENSELYTSKYHTLLSLFPELTEIK